MNSAAEFLTHHLGSTNQKHRALADAVVIVVFLVAMLDTIVVRWSVRAFGDIRGVRGRRSWEAFVAFVGGSAGRVGREHRRRGALHRRRHGRRTQVRR